MAVQFCFNKPCGEKSIGNFNQPEFWTGIMSGNDKIWAKWVRVGNPYGGASEADIAQSGDLVTGVKHFIGVMGGVILRKSRNQVHAISAVSNAPDEHASIIFFESNKISYWFNQSMTLTSFKNRPFAALVWYTKQ